MNGDEALEYLGASNATHIKGPGDDAQCDEAVASVCKDYRGTGPLPRFYTDEPARRACSVLLIYASRYLSQAALTGEPAMLDNGLIVIDVSDASRLDPHEAARILDRFILLVGTINAESLLLIAAARLMLSEDLTSLIRSRIDRMA